MAVTKLTKSIRDDVENALIKRAFAERAQKVIDFGANFADLVYRHVFSEELEKMNSLPPGWLPEQEIFLVSFRGELQNLSFNGSWMGIGIVRLGLKKQDSKPRRFLWRSMRSRVANFEASDPMTEKFFEVINQSEDLKKEISSAQKRARAILDSASSDKQLFEKWPEIESVARPLIGTGSTAPLPVVSRKEINAHLNLPAEEN